MRDSLRLVLPQPDGRIATGVNVHHFDRRAHNEDDYEGVGEEWEEILDPQEYDDDLTTPATPIAVAVHL